MLPRAFFLALCFALFLQSQSQSQTPPHLWSQRFGDSNYQDTGQTAVDETGNGVLTGTFSGTVDFGGGALTAGYFKDVFLAKFDLNGTHVWSKQFGDASDDQVGSGVAFDGSGNVLLTGYFRGSVNFGDKPLTSQGGDDLFLAKFNPAGEHLWSKRFGDWQYQNCSHVCVDPGGNVILAGAFEGTVDFGGGPLTSLGDDDLFLAKFDADGNHIWSKRFGDSNSQWTNAGVSADVSGDVFLAGEFFGAVDFGGGLLTSSGGTDVFLAKFDADGNHIWSKQFGDAAWQSPASVALDPLGTGNVLLTGSFDGTMDFGGDPLVGQGLGDIFLAKFDRDGKHLWSQRFGDESQQHGTGVAVDGLGNVLITGNFEGTVDFGGGALVNVGAADIYCAKFDPSGAHVWSKRYGDNGVTLYHYSVSVAADPWGNALFAGHFDGALTFGPQSLVSHGGFDIFLAKLIPSDDPTSVQSVTPSHEFALGSNYPNPFTPTTTITYSLAERGWVTLRIYNAAGQLVRTLVNETQSPRADGFTTAWDGTSDAGQPAASGVYFYQLRARELSQTKKMVFLK